MICLINSEANVKLEFSFLKNLPEDFKSIENKSEKWIYFTLYLSTPERNISISQDMHASMTVFEIEKIYNGINALLIDIDKEDKRFTHYNSEGFFEISVEYLPIDDCFSVELWLIAAEYPGGKIEGYDAGFRFMVGKPEMYEFLEQFYDSFKMICS